jgi:hypothetical protein
VGASRGSRCLGIGYAAALDERGAHRREQLAVTHRLIALALEHLPRLAPQRVVAALELEPQDLRALVLVRR